MSNQYPNSGKLSHNKYKMAGDRKPDWVGEIQMDRSVLRDLMSQHTDDEITIKLSGWNMSGNYGPWIRMSWNNYQPNKEAGYTPRKPEPQQPTKPEDDSDVPF